MRVDEEKASWPQAGEPRAAALSPTTSRASASRHRLARIRSQNGYSVDDRDMDDGDETQVEEHAGGDARGDTLSLSREKDPYEVGWEGGDADPLCPRSFSHKRKWLIAIIVSHVSLCV